MPQGTRRNNLPKHRFVVSTLAALAAIFVTVGIVFAAWSMTGSGSGGASATVAQGVTLTAVVPASPGSAATLYPGGPPSTVYFNASNPNPYAVIITSVTWGTPVSLNTTSCPSSNISVDASAPKTGLSIVIAPNPQTQSYTIANVLDLSHAAPDGCQGVGFSVPMTITGTQQ
jgi:hypothetical protein